MVKHRWWKESVVYQIYPRSFNDSNNDGIGDIPGIIEKLDYIKKLGIDVIWLCPIYESPNADNGYDISDYRAVMDEFGDLEDLEKLIAEIHKRDMKIIMDLVVNHTSDEHEWFIKSKKSKDNPYRDYYIWKEGKEDNQPPNNWGSFFGGSTWTYDEKTEEYYLHLFTEKQPDLNWENKEVRDNIYEMMRWWLDKGIDGFRMDVINMISKDQSFPDGKKGPNDDYGDGTPYFINGPRLYQYIKEMGENVLFDYDIMTVGETFNFGVENAKKFAKADGKDLLNMVFHFELMSVDRQDDNKWVKKEIDLTEIKDIYKKWNQELYEKGWNAIYLGNHDQPRIVSRFGDDEEYREESAKMLATMMMTMPGTPYIFQGEEIGMTNVAFDDIGKYRDVETINYMRIQTRKGRSKDKVMEDIHRVSRDNSRTPMQWNDNLNAGFTKSTPWINVNPNYKEINVKNALKDEDSIFYHYQEMIKLRKQNPALIYGRYLPILEEHKQIFAYRRIFEDDEFLVVLNFFGNDVEVSLPAEINLDNYQLVMKNYENKNKKQNSLTLKPYESLVFKLS
ncbi:MAG TPA: alpha-glucosidase [Halanaerobiales bacterium]|nr:alpha-glucosidase [Halanaerobiales bacterium]